MVDQLRRGEPFTAESTVIYGTIRISGYLCNHTLLHIDENTASPMAHTAMAFHHLIIAIDGHLTGRIRIVKIGHLALLLPDRLQLL
jgi:hypothetical protein